MTVPLRIVALAPNAWRGEWFNRQHLLSRLAPRHRIVYSNGVFHSWERTSPDYAAAPWLPKFVEQDGVCLHLRGRLPVRVARLPRLDRCILRRLCRDLRARVAGSDGPLIAHLFNPEFEPYVKPLSPDYVVYHAYDLFRAMLGAPPELVEQENRLVAVADLVIATSPETARDLKSRGAREPHVLGNGVDCERFDVHDEAPTELDGVPRPRIGYVGTMNPKVDFDLLVELARRRPQWNFALIGPVRNLRQQDADAVRRLDALPNVFRHDKVPQAHLGRYLSRLDVGVICYRTSLGWPSAGYPLKLLEYLACGIPVVSTGLETVRPFSDQVALADTPDEWEAALAAAVSGTGPGTAQGRREVARANSWNVRARRLEELLQSMVVAGVREKLHA
jgi:glycosyltransferase involved in cell wall biosynthesis